MVSGIDYKPFGPVTGLTYGNGLTETRTYDEDYRLTSLTVPNTLSWTLGYNADDDITGLTDNLVGSNSQTLGYDNLNRLNTGSGAYGSLSYGYDANGNRNTETLNGTTTTFNLATSSNELLSLSGGININYSYDANGNLTGDGTYTYTYDDTNRLAGVTKTGLTASYIYNGLGQRVEKTVNGTSTVFVYDEAGHLLGEYTPSGTLIAEHIWLNDRPIGVITSAGLYYVHIDQLDTPRVITNSSKTIVWQWNSDPFGNTTPTGSLTYNLRFPGQYYDAETGHNYNYFRDYDPSIGRYIESDPLGLAGRSYSTYSYVNDNPMSKVDPCGLYDCVYSISAHSMNCAPDLPGDPSFSSNSYVSGNNGESSCPKCQNNPDYTNVPFHGPIPAGIYTIGPPTTPGGYRRNLTPNLNNRMFTRNSFQLHGCPNPATCSEGCIGATSNAVRDLLNADLSLEEGQNTLTVLP